MSLIPRVLFIDWYKTLSSSLFWQHLPPEVFGPIERWMFKENPQRIRSWMRGQEGAADIVAGLAQSVGLSPQFLEQELEASCRKAQLISEDSLQMVKAIRCKGITAVIATDNMDVFEKFTAPALNLRDHFDDILCSSSLGCLKSDEDENGQLPFFQPWLNRNGFKIQEAVLIDDSVQHADFFERKGLAFLGVDGSLPLTAHLARWAN